MTANDCHHKSRYAGGSIKKSVVLGSLLQVFHLVAVRSLVVSYKVNAQNRVQKKTLDTLMVLIIILWHYLKINREALKATYRSTPFNTLLSKPPTAHSKAALNCSGAWG